MPRELHDQAVLASMNLEPADLFFDTPAPFVSNEARPRLSSSASPARSKNVKAMTSYAYRNAEDDVAFEQVRYDYEDGSKDFRIRRPDGSGGWIYDLKGVPLVLYRLPELLAADPSVRAYLVEGEKCADALLDLGLLATTSPLGAGKWRPEYTETLRGRHVICLADNDEPGRAHMQTAVESLVGIAASVKRPALPGLADKGDIADWIAAGGTREALVALAAATPEVAQSLSAISSNTVLADRQLPADILKRFRTAKQIALETPIHVRWVAKPWLAAGAITNADGKIKASGKTTWLLGMSRQILDGLPFMGEPTEKGPVVFLTEQAASSFGVALKRAGLLGREDLSVLYWRDVVECSWPDIVDAAREKCRLIGARVLTVDTLAQFSGVVGESENESGAALEAMRPLQIAAAQDGLAVLMSRHERKSGGEVGDSGRGSSAYAGAADIVLQIRRMEGQGRETLRVICSLSRFDETPSRLVMDLQDGHYVALGTTEAVAHQETREKILAALPSDEADALATDDLVGVAVGVSRALVQNVLADLVREGKARRIGKGRAHDPFKFLSARTPLLSVADTNGHVHRAADEDLVAYAGRRFGGKVVQVRPFSLGLRTDAESGH